MSILMLANIQYSKTEGISKKIISQARAFSKISTLCDLVCYFEGGILVLSFENGDLFGEKTYYSFNKQPDNSLSSKRKVFRLLCLTADNILGEKNYENVYVRHMVPGFILLSFLRKAKKKAKVYYEIPTYPYYFEQWAGATNKIRTACRLCIETFFWPCIYMCINRLVVIRSNSKAKIFRKMILSVNGVDLRDIGYRCVNQELNSLEMIGVGTIYPYHGYECIIWAIRDYYLKERKFDVRFHIVGESAEIDRLKEIVFKNHLENYVLFYGKKYGEELDEVFRKANLGVGCLALEMRKADIDTTIKDVEYIARGLPFISNGLFYDMGLEGKNCLKIDNTNVDFDVIFSFVKMYYASDCAKETEEIVQYFKWESINRRILDT